MRSVYSVLSKKIFSCLGMMFSCQQLTDLSNRCTSCIYLATKNSCYLLHYLQCADGIKFCVLEQSLLKDKTQFVSYSVNGFARSYYPFRNKGYVNFLS